MMFDCHVHFDESLVSAEGMIASMDAAGIDRAALIAAINPDLKDTLILRHAAPLMRSAVAGSVRPLRRGMRWLYGSWVKDGEAEVGGKTYPLVAQPDNDPIIGAVRAHPDRFVGWIFVNPAGPADPLEEIRRGLKTPGMIGVKSHAYWHGYPIAALESVAAICEEQGLPLLVHLGVRGAGDFKLLPERFPRLRLVYAHAGIPYQRAVCEYARERDNVFVDLSSPGYVSAQMAATAIRLATPRKCLFGSDGPYFHHSGDRVDYATPLDIFHKTGLRGQPREWVAGANFAAILERKS